MATDSLTSNRDPDWKYILNWRGYFAASEDSWPFLAGPWLVCADLVSIGWCRYTPDCPLSLPFLSRNSGRLTAVRKFLLGITDAVEQLEFEIPWTTDIELAGDEVWYQGEKYSCDLINRSSDTDIEVAHIEAPIRSPGGEPCGKGMCLVTKWGHHGYSLIANCT